MNPTPYYSNFGITVYGGDCLDVLAGLPDASVHAVTTDPPYELAFMGRCWDSTGVAFNPAVWRECLRVLTPGGHLLAFGGSRTWHRLAAAVEDAGFEIRDSIAWLHASGFPKSLDVSKAIDKAAGVERLVVGMTSAGASSLHRVSRVEQGYRDVLTGCTPEDIPVTAPATDAAREWQGWGTALKPAFEPIVVGRKPLAGTVASTVLEHSTGALNIDGCRIEADFANARANKGGDLGYHGGTPQNRGWSGTAGRWPSNVVLTHADDCAERCEPGCPVRELDEQAGMRSSGVLTPANNLKERHSDSMSGKEHGGPSAARVCRQQRWGLPVLPGVPVRGEGPGQ